MRSVSWPSDRSAASIASMVPMKSNSASSSAAKPSAR
jgi:hypothetical protein